MSSKKFSLPSAVALVLIAAIALFVRAYFSRNLVFAGQAVNFQGADAWYHMRLVDNLVRHFSHPIHFDPYAVYPGGQDMAVGPFFDALLGSVILLFSRGTPSQHWIDTAGAYYPAVLGSLVVIPAYFFAKHLFDRKAGLVAAALVAVLPGGLVGISLLGSTDHHVAETLFAASTMLFLLLAVQSGRKGVRYQSFFESNARKNRALLIHTLLAGVMLGCYLLTWMGGAFLVLVILVWAVIQGVLDEIGGESSDYIAVVVVPCLTIALLMVLPFRGVVRYMNYHVDALLGAVLTVLALNGVFRGLKKTTIRRVYYPVVIAALLICALGILYLLIPGVVRTFVMESHRFRPKERALTVLEVKSLFFYTGSPSGKPLWDEFTSSFPLALVSLAILGYEVIIKNEAGKALLVVWSIFMFCAALFGQGRFTCYMVVNVAILTSYFCARLWEWAGSGKPHEKVKSERKPALFLLRLQRSRAARPSLAALVMVWVFYPNPTSALLRPVELILAAFGRINPLFPTLVF